MVLLSPGRHSMTDRVTQFLPQDLLFLLLTHRASSGLLSAPWPTQFPCLFYVYIIELARSALGIPSLRL